VQNLDRAISAQTVAGEPAALRLPDGRVLAWTEWGPAGGRPVLFCTGAGMSGSLGFAIPVLAALGLRMLALDRPGLGRSSPHRGKTLSTWVADAAHLIERHDLRGALAVGFSQGAPFALALAGAGLVRAVAVVAGQDELPGVRRLLHPDVAAMLATARADPDGFEHTIRSTATADWLWSLILAMSAERDRRLYTGSSLGPAYRAALEEGFVQGPAGYARDLRLVLGPWPTPVEKIVTPVHLWYGARDTSTVHSPDSGRTLAGRLPCSRLHVLPDEGSSLLWTQGAHILTELARPAVPGPG
jgi:pimeloyl-ACP methyl ester carboxylesterase